MSGHSSLHWAVLPFVLGIVVGLSVSTVLLVRPYTEHVVTNVYIDVVGGAGNLLQSKEVRERLQRYEELMRELHPDSHLSTGPKLLSEETLMKDPVHYAVMVTQMTPFPDTLDTLSNTWAGGVSENRVSYYLSHRDDTDDQGDTKTPKTRSDVVKLSTEVLDEVQVLKHICKHRLNSTKWFFIGYDTVYVKTQELESYLLTLEDSQDRLPYLGKPVKREPVGRLCLPGPGTVLSYQALTEVCPRLSGCEGMREEELKTDCALGECVHRLLPDVQCNKEGYPQNLFLRFDAGKKGPIIDPKNKVVLNRALTVYPVSDFKLMYNIHQLVVGRRLNESQHLVQELKQTANQMTALLPRSETGHAQSDANTLKSRADIVSWQLISNSRLMVQESDDPAIKTPELWKQEVEVLSSRAVEYLSVLQEEQPLVLHKIVNIYWRHHPIKGVEYIVDFEAESQQEDNPTFSRFCAYLSRSYSPLQVSPLQPQVKESKRVTIALVVTADQLDTLETFMKQLARVLDQDQRLDLIVVRMRTERDRQQAKKDTTDSALDTLLHSYETKYLRASFTAVDSPYILSRSHGLALVLHEIKPTDILFLADLYLTFNTSFLERCRSLPLQGQQAYYPIPFAMNSNGIAVSSELGHWLVKSHGVGCVYAADILSSIQTAEGKGIPKEIDSEKLYKRLLLRDYELIRSVDSGLWRQRPSSASGCELDLVGEEKEVCEEAQPYAVLRDRAHLSEMLFDHEREQKF